MNKLVESEIREHAKASIPDECCGFIVIDNNGKVARTIQTDNIAEEKNYQFVIDPKRYLEAEKVGKVIAYYHSHTLGDEQFSDADKVNSEALRLPMFVYSTLTDKFNFYTPSNYVAPLIGREFVWGIFDCWSLTVDYYKKELGIELDNSFFRKDLDDLIKGNLFENNYEKVGFKVIPTNEPLKINDLLLMRSEANVANHVAIYLGNDLILHHPGGRLSQRTFYGSYWKKVTHLRIRYKDLW